EEDRREREADGDATRGAQAPPLHARLYGLVGLLVDELRLGICCPLATQRRDDVARKREDEEADEETPASMRFPFHVAWLRFLWGGAEASLGGGTGASAAAHGLGSTIGAGLPG